MADMSSCTGREKGRAFYGFAFVVNAMILVGMLLVAAGTALLAEPYVRDGLNTLRLIIPFVYLPAAVFYFARIRVYIVALIAAYAYDLWFRLYTGLPPLMLLTEHPVWTACVLVTVLSGLLCRGFRWHWWFRLPRPTQQNDFLSTDENR